MTLCPIDGGHCGCDAGGPCINQTGADAMSDDLRKAAQSALDACTDVVSGWQCLAPATVQRAAVEALDNLRAALVAPTPEPSREQAFTAWAERFGLSPEDPGAGIANIAHAAGFEAGRKAGGRDGERLRAIIEHGWIVVRDLEGEWQIKAPRRYGAPVLIAESMSLFHAIDLADAALDRGMQEGKS